MFVYRDFFYPSNRFRDRTGPGGNCNTNPGSIADSAQQSFYSPCGAEGDEGEEGEDAEDEEAE